MKAATEARRYIIDGVAFVDAILAICCTIGALREHYGLAAFMGLLLLIPKTYDRSEPK